MAGMIPPSPVAPLAATNFPSDIDTAALANERMRQLALLLQQEANQPIQLPQQPGARVSWAQPIAKMLQAYTAVKMMNRSDAAAAALQQQRMQGFPAIDQLLRQGAGIGETPAQPAQPGVDLSQVTAPAGQESAAASVPPSRLPQEAQAAQQWVGMPDAMKNNMAMELAGHYGIPLDRVKLMQQNAENQAALMQARNTMSGQGDVMGYNAPGTQPFAGAAMQGGAGGAGGFSGVPEVPANIRAHQMLGRTNPAYKELADTEEKAWRESIKPVSVAPGSLFRINGNHWATTPDANGNYTEYDQNMNIVGQHRAPGANENEAQVGLAKAFGPAVFTPHNFNDINQRPQTDTMANVAINNGIPSLSQLFGTPPSAAPTQAPPLIPPPPGQAVAPQPSPQPGMIPRQVSFSAAPGTAAQVAQFASADQGGAPVAQAPAFPPAAGVPAVAAQLAPSPAAATTGINKYTGPTAAEVAGAKAAAEGGATNPQATFTKAKQDLMAAYPMVLGAQKAQTILEDAMKNNTLTTGTAAQARGELVNAMQTMGLGRPADRQKIINNQVLDNQSIQSIVQGLKVNSEGMRVFSQEMTRTLQSMGRTNDPAAQWQMYQNLVDSARVAAEKTVNQPITQYQKDFPAVKGLDSLRMDLPPSRENPWAPKASASDLATMAKQAIDAGMPADRVRADYRAKTGKDLQ